MSATGFELAARLPDEGPMLAGVVANLADDTPKLVYADWLDEHHDPRGDFLRRYVAAAASGAELPDPAGMPAGWLEVIGFRLEARLRALQLADRRDTFRRLARPAVAIYTEPCEESDIPPGGTKFGGVPHLPAGAEWPGATRGSPDTFIAQFDLAEVARTVAGRDLPADGLLSFTLYYPFYTPAGTGVCQVTPPDAVLADESVCPEEPRRVTLADALSFHEEDLTADMRHRAWEAGLERFATEAAHHELLGGPDPGDELPVEYGTEGRRRLLWVKRMGDISWFWDTSELDALQWWLTPAQLRTADFDKAIVIPENT